MKTNKPTTPVSGARAIAPVVIGLVSAVMGMSGAWAVGAATRQEDQSGHLSTSLQQAVARHEVADRHGAPTLQGPVTLIAFLDPIAGCGVNSPFGMRKMPWEEGGRLHEGVDIAAPAGSLVRATADGVVGRTGVSGSYGRYVEIVHSNGLTSFYAHMQRLAGLKTGQAVTAGQTVGYAGSTGRSTGSHLHFEIRFNGRPLNPALFLGQTFASAKDLPLTAAARVPRQVRLAQVSRWPVGVGAPAAPRQAATVQVAAAQPVRIIGGRRMHMTLTPVSDLKLPKRDEPKADAPDASGYRPGDLPISRPTPKAAPPIRTSPSSTTDRG